MDVQLRQLEYFTAVAETRHFTRAAESVHVAQPSLSKQIGTLERELGTPLFRRARGNVTLTAAGETLLPLARRILADVDNAQRASQRARRTGSRSPAARGDAEPVDGAAARRAPAILRELPGIDIFVEERGGRDLVRLLAQGELDLALIVLPLQTHDPALGHDCLPSTNRWSSRRPLMGRTFARGRFGCQDLALYHS